MPGPCLCKNSRGCGHLLTCALAAQGPTLSAGALCAAAAPLALTHTAAILTAHTTRSPAYRCSLE